MRWATAGTVLAAREAVHTSGIVMNLSGGYHHASASRGEGFCVYADVGVAVASLRASGELTSADRILYIDLDAHQGNGVARVFEHDRSVFILDAYNAVIYPRDAHARRRIDCDLPLMPGCPGAHYLRTIEAEVPKFIDALARGSPPPRLAVYNAGTDILAGDPLGQMSVPADTVLERDRLVIRHLADRHIPTVILPSGGYTRDSYRLVAATAEWVLRTFE